MGRSSTGKHKSTKFLLVCVVGLLGVALIADLLWASSSYKSVASNRPIIQQSDTLIAPSFHNNSNQVHSHVDIYNFTDNTWGGRFDMPKEMAHSHLGMATDGRYIYVVTGQYGLQCRGPTAHTFVLDTETKQWQDMPPLPVPRACVVVDDRLYVIGGQEGDFMAKPGSPIFKCSRRNEVVYDDVYMLDDEMKWKVLPPMPKPEFAWVVVNNSIVIVGGTTDKHPVTKKMTLVGEILQFQLDTLDANRYIHESLATNSDDDNHIRSSKRIKSSKGKGIQFKD